MTIALEYLRWLDSQELKLQTAGQADLDSWLAEGPTTRAMLRDFVRWTNRCNLTTDLHVPCRSQGEPTDFFDEDEHLAHLVRCVNDTELPLDIRVAGALILLYGVSVTRITSLTQHDIDHRNDGTYITLGQQPVLLPPALQRLVIAQAETTGPSVVGRATPSPQQWLFPGLLAGRPLAPGKLSQRLTRHGIDTRTARNTAL